MKTALISCANHRCGIGRYSFELAAALNNTELETTLFRKDPAEQAFVINYPYRSFRNLRHYVAPYFLRQAISGKSFDIVHADYVDAATAYDPRCGAPLIVTVHDAIPFHFRTSRMAFQWYRQQLRRAAKQAHRLIVVSQVSKDDLVQLTDIPASKIAVVHNGINHQVFYPNEQQTVNPRFTIRYVGGLGGPYKNVGLLLKMAKVLEEWKVNFLLEIAGGHPEQTPLPQMAREMGLTKVRFTGFIPDRNLRSYLAGADLFVYPSLYEGFGFPPLEAMACGTATVATRAGSLPEVLGNGAVLVHPDPTAFAAAARDISRNFFLRKELEGRAVKQARNFTWERAAGETMAIYREALGPNVHISRRAS